MSKREEIIDRIREALRLEAHRPGRSHALGYDRQTGSILLTARSAGGRALSVLPPHHIIIAQERQLLPDLPAAFELLQRTYNGNYPSLITFITGPSRTGDIERILVLGAHGPRFLTIFFLPNET